MIDVWKVAANSLWILGLAIMLATFSYQQWLGPRTIGGAKKRVFASEALRRAWTSGILLLCIGWGTGQAARWWEKALCALLAAACGLEWFGPARTKPEQAGPRDRRTA